MNPPAKPPAAIIHWHNLPAGEALARLNINPVQGLPRDEAVRRLAEHGPNTLPETKHRSL